MYLTAGEISRILYLMENCSIGKYGTLGYNYSVKAKLTPQKKHLLTTQIDLTLLYCTGYVSPTYRLLGGKLKAKQFSKGLSLLRQRQWLLVY